MKKACALLAASMIVLAGCGSGHNQLLRPIHGAQIAPQPAPASCPIVLGHGTPGACAPLRERAPGPFTFALAYPASVLDVSNNDPITCADWANVTTAGAYVKLNESTTFIDGTAAAQLACARHYKPNLYLGGYDFLHVCSPSARSEAQLFIARVLALRLIGPRTLAPMGDAEYGRCPSAAAARAWIEAWLQTVHATLHRAGLYTGAWYFDPTFGCFWPAGTTSWISGYGVSWPFIPCGHPALGLWQRTDHGFNGATNADLSVWVRSKAEFLAFAADNARDWLREGDHGRGVFLLSHRLAVAGWLAHSGTFYSHHLATVVRAYQQHHGLRPATGIAGHRTQASIRSTAEHDRAHHVRDVPRPR